MKKMLKRIMVLVVAATLFVMPASTALAASNLVLVDRTANSVSYAYQPDPYYLRAGQGLVLINDYVADDLYHVKGWTNFTFWVDLQYYSTFRIFVTNMNTGQLVFTDEFSSYGCGITVPNNSSSEAVYRVIIDGVTDTYVTTYTAIY
jgi:hypothetical protein